jgi:signal peptidase II
MLGGRRFLSAAPIPLPLRSAIRRYIELLGLALGVIALDQATKALVVHSLSHGRVINLFGGLVLLDYTVNSGAAFGILRARGLLFILVAVLVSGFIIVSYRRVVTSPLPIRIALGLILGGAIGNLIDRIRLGHVVDFIDLGWWPVFNLADSSIVVGVVLLALLAMVTDRGR